MQKLPARLTVSALHQKARCRPHSLARLAYQGHDFRLEGYNTDIYGFDMSISPLLTNKHDTALILGDGGAARAVKCVLDNKGITYKCVTRKPFPGNILFSDLTVKDIKENKLIINTTPVGTYPNVDDCPPIPYEAITDEHLLFDLIYNPEANPVS
jgi:shikimate dehydrogenase